MSFNFEPLKQEQEVIFSRNTLKLVTQCYFLATIQSEKVHYKIILEWF